MRRFSLPALGIVLGIMLGAGFASSATATDPLPLDPGYVTDRAGVLSSTEKASSERVLQRLQTDTDVNLFVVFVDHFTFPSDAEDWANEVFDSNNLGPHQYLFAVAIEGRDYYLAAHQQGALTDDELAAIERAAQSQLSASNWAGAINTVADGIKSAIAPTTPTTPTSPGGNNTADNGSGMFWLFGMLAVFALVVVLIVRSAKKNAGMPRAAIPGAANPYSTVSDKDLERQAGSALVQTDDAVTSSRDEVGFATAQFGDGATATFTRAVDLAAKKLSEAFSLRQKLDDEIPDPPSQRREWHIQILELCQEANALLDENVQAFEELRKLEANAPAALEQVRQQRELVGRKLDAAPALLASLAAVFSPSALNTVSDNPEQASTRLALADRGISEAEQFIASGENGGAAFSIRTAEEAVLQASQLLTSLESLGSALADIEDKARALIGDLESDLAIAATLPDATGTLAGIAASTRTRVEQARKELAAAGGRDPQRVLTALDAANTEIDASIANARTVAEQTRRRKEQLEQKLLQAQTQIRAAHDYITTRRGAVGATPRTRLAEAEAALQQAINLQTQNPEQSLQFATRAFELARQAITTAESEISMFNAPGGSGSLGSDIVGGIVGGIISSALSGGGSRSRSWSSGSSRSWSGGSSWSRPGSSGGGFNTSGFGGSRSRSGGGRF